MNVAEYICRVHDLGCLVCEQMGQPSAPVEAHHVGLGGQQSDWLVVPLCTEHHRGATGVHGLSRRGFVMRYQLTDLEMVGKTIAKIFRGI